MYHKILSLSIPNIISNITIPLVGMADLAIVGLIGSDTMLSAIAIGTAVFNMLYYTFAFLRMGTSGITAQAYGRKDFSQMSVVILRGAALALLLSIVILLLSPLIISGSLWFMDGSMEAEVAAASYFNIRIWAAPATLMLYVIQGWFIGMQNSKSPMWIALIINVINIVLSYIFAIVLGFGLDGVAYGTLIAQWSGVFLSLIFLLRFYKSVFRRAKIGHHTIREIMDGKRLRSFFFLNADILIRTLCLVSVVTYFTKASSTLGDATLSANTILMQLFTLFSYFMDGFAYAGESLSGKFYGAGSHSMLKLSISKLFKIGFYLSLLFSVLYIIGGDYIIGIFTRSESVIDVARNYLIWAAAIPLCGFAAFLWDGVLVGMTLSHILRNSMLIATSVFFAIYFSLGWLWGNDALWIAFLFFLITRGFVQWLSTLKVLKSEIDLSRFWNRRVDMLKERLKRRH